MKSLLLSAVALAAVAGIAPAFAYSAPVPQQPRSEMKHEMKAVTRTEMLQKVQDHFASLDTNRDGFVSKAEMDAAEATMHQRMADRLKQRESGIFDRMDANHDGSVSRAEFDAAHNAMAARMDKGMGMRAMHGGMAGHMFAAADTNKDGRVSLQEATAAASAHFDKLDANHDGTVTPDELRAARKGMRGASGRR